MLQTLRDQVLEGARRAYDQRRLVEKLRYGLRPIATGPAGHDIVRRTISTGCAAIGKIGESELRGVRDYLRYRNADGTCEHWPRSAVRLNRNAGVFPGESRQFSQFAQEYLSSLQSVDTLAVWYNKDENRVVREFCSAASLVEVRCLQPVYWRDSWFSLLNNKTLLVVSPFERTIRYQYQRVADIWKERLDMRPLYGLETIRCPFSNYIENSPYSSWTDTLADMKAKMADTNFDVAVIGAGAWSVPLAAHAKALGKVGIHLGGGTQLLFGIVGKRFENNLLLMQKRNEYWIRPLPEETPEKSVAIEGGCYW